MDIVNTKINQILNLRPGQEVDFFNLKWKFLKEKESLDKDILFYPTNICDDIMPKYIAEAYHACPYKIVIYCKRDEQGMNWPKNLPLAQKLKTPKTQYIQKDIQGVVGLIFAKPYLDGIYISITCSTSFFEGKTIPTKFGLLLRTAIINYAFNHLNISNFYNHAANEGLVKYYRRLGWILTNQQCGVEDAVSQKFSKISSEELDEFLKSFDVSLIKTPSGFPMRLCLKNLQSLNENTIKNFMDIYPKLLAFFEKQKTFCLPKNNFSSSLTDPFATMEERKFDDEFQITNPAFLEDE